MIIRPHYIDTLRTYQDVPLVKILVGIRRYGKSIILEMLAGSLALGGVAADHIITMRYTWSDFDDGMSVHNSTPINLYELRAFRQRTNPFH